MSRAWMPLYVADYLADTGHLNAAQSGAYLHLIMHYWQTGKLPTNDEALARIARMTDREWQRSRPTICAFFSSDWRHKRIDAELAKAAEISNKRKAAAEQRHSRSSANAEQKDTQSQSQSPSQEERKEDTADAVSSSKVYAFEAGVIRLTEKNLNQWKQAFSYLDVPAELMGLQEWAAKQPKWFPAVSGALAKRNREIKLARDRPQGGGDKTNWRNAIQ